MPFEYVAVQDSVKVPLSGCCTLDGSQVIPVNTESSAATVLTRERLISLATHAPDVQELAWERRR